MPAGTPRDTLELRQKIADSNDRLKLSAKGIGERLKAAVTADSTPQNQKILSNFQARGFLDARTGSGTPFIAVQQKPCECCTLCTSHAGGDLKSCDMP